MALSATVVVLIFQKQIFTVQPVNATEQPTYKTVNLMVGQSTDVFSMGNNGPYENTRYVNLIYGGRYDGGGRYLSTFIVEVWSGSAHFAYTIYPDMGDFYIYNKLIHLVDFDWSSATIEIYD